MAHNVTLVRHPSKRWGFVGTLPTALANEKPATNQDIFAFRAHTGKDGKFMVWDVPTFPTKAEAMEYANTRGVTYYDLEGDKWYNYPEDRE